MDTEGLIAAGFVHRTSRAADPQLHTHVLVANKVRADDGAWLALDGRELFATQKATGMLYKAALRAELTERLGVEWTAVDDNGAAEIAGVPRALLEYWSARRHELKTLGDELIANRAAELGRSLSPNERAECFQIAAYRTRTPKIDAETPTEELRARWRSEAEAWGHAPERWLPEVTGRRPPAPERRIEEAAAEIIARLEERTATWTRARVVEEVARVVTGADAELLRVAAERLTDYVLADAAVLGLASPLPVEVPATLRRRDGMAQHERHGASRFTTRATLRREAAVLELVARGREANAAVVPEAIAARVLDRSSLGEDQREAVRGLVSGGERVALLVGPAGTGKSRALDAAREAWIAAGFDPIGLAPSAMAASVLRDEAGLRSDTLAKFLFDTESGRSTFLLDHRSVVVLDEAGMARTDDLAKLLHLVEERDAKVVLVGDPHQNGCGRTGRHLPHARRRPRRPRARNRPPLPPRLGGRGLAPPPRREPVDPPRLPPARPARGRQPSRDGRARLRGVEGRARRRPVAPPHGRRQRDRGGVVAPLSCRARCPRSRRGRERADRDRPRQLRRRGRDARERPADQDQPR